MVAYRSEERHHHPLSSHSAHQSQGKLPFRDRMGLLVPNLNRQGYQSPLIGTSWLDVCPVHAITNDRGCTPGVQQPSTLSSSCSSTRTRCTSKSAGSSGPCPTERIAIRTPRPTATVQSPYRLRTIRKHPPNALDGLPAIPQVIRQPGGAARVAAGGCCRTDA